MPTSLMTVGPRNPGSDPAGDERAAIQFLLAGSCVNYNDVTSSLGVRDRPRQRSELTVTVLRSLDLQQRVNVTPDLLEVLRAHLVEELPELLHLALLVVALDEDGGLAEHVLLGEDGRVGPDGEGDGVARAARHRELGAVLAQLDGGVEGAFLQLGDHDPLDGHHQLVQQVLEQVVGERPLGGHALEGEGDGRRLDVADPDREEALAVALLEEDDRRLGWQLDPYADEGQLDQREPPRASNVPGARPGACRTARGYQTP